MEVRLRSAAFRRREPAGPTRAAATQDRSTPDL